MFRNSSDFETLNLSSDIYCIFPNIYNLFFRTQANYIAWINIKKLIPFLCDSFRSAERSFEKASAGQVASKPRWKSCIILSIDNMGYALSALFVEHYFMETAKNQVNIIIVVINNTIRNYFGLIIQTNFVVYLYDLFSNSR